MVAPELSGATTAFNTRSGTLLIEAVGLIAEMADMYYSAAT